MPKEKMTSLAQFIKDLMRRRHVNRNIMVAQIVERSGGQISEGYLNSILDRGTVNLSVAKIKALADGLEVSVGEVLTALGLEVREAKVEPICLELSDVMADLPDDAKEYLKTTVTGLIEFARKLKVQKKKRANGNK